MKAIMTVTGVDHPGIVAAVATTCADNNVNILNISQTLMDQFFTMILQVDFDDQQLPLEQLQTAMTAVGATQGLEIRVQSEAIFKAMHTL
ncbi:MAG: ACT domain-containing protein [Actinomycetaceae bacterium]|nr:ACT domain-containing protein [Actinomycetaceae bacterium]